MAERQLQVAEQANAALGSEARAAADRAAALQLQVAELEAAQQQRVAELEAASSAAAKAAETHEAALKAQISELQQKEAASSEAAKAAEALEAALKAQISELQRDKEAAAVAVARLEGENAGMKFSMSKHFTSIRPSLGSAPPSGLRSYLETFLRCDYTAGQGQPAGGAAQGVGASAPRAP